MDRGTRAGTFERHRPTLVRVAYRMLGSLSDAEDVLQEAYLRYDGGEAESILAPEAFLRRIVVRLCLDHLKSARRRRESYVGTWLPEPLVEPPEGEADDFVLPLLLALERLSPLERAAFLLHDVFDVPFEEVAEAIHRDPAACRQLARRAREHLRAERPRFQVSPARGRAFAEAFFAASRNGETARLRALLSEEVAIYSDGGGKASSLEHPSIGIASALALFESLRPTFEAAPSVLLRYCRVNGLPGFLTVEGGGILQTTALQVEEGRIRGVYVVRNPDKLRHIQSGA